MDSIPTGRLLTPDEAGAMLGLSKQRLALWRVTGDGPIFRKLGRRTVRYSEADIQSWLATRSRRSTSDANAAA